MVFFLDGLSRKVCKRYTKTFTRAQMVGQMEREGVEVRCYRHSCAGRCDDVHVLHTSRRSNKGAQEGACRVLVQRMQCMRYLRVTKSGKQTCTHLYILDLIVTQQATAVGDVVQADKMCPSRTRFGSQQRWQSLLEIHGFEQQVFVGPAQTCPCQRSWGVHQITVARACRVWTYQMPCLWPRRATPRTVGSRQCPWRQR